MIFYLVCVLFFAFIVSCFYGKKAYERRYMILLISLFLSLIPVSIGNFVARSNEKYTKVVTKSYPLKERGVYVDTLTNDTTKLFVEIGSTYVHFTANEKKSKTDLIVHYIKVDSVHVPRYEVTKEKILNDGWYYSSWGIPSKNRTMHLYLPNDQNMILIKNYINEKKKKQEKKS